MLIIDTQIFQKKVCDIDIAVEAYKIYILVIRPS